MEGKPILPMVEEFIAYVLVAPPFGEEKQFGRPCLHYDSRKYLLDETV